MLRQAASIAETSADILLHRACIFPELKNTKLARKGGFLKSLRSILRADVRCRMTTQAKRPALR
jgi:hypothetical protein